ncbi:MAG: RNA polymerase subunit sigma-24, partial [Flavobacteriales bacterium CG_4_10_14_0_8_um_filter_32_5]
IVLFEITGFSIKEIMEIQNSSESAVKQRLKRGREKLVELLTFESDYKTKEVKNGTR